jgi:hypothetical protein
MKEKTWEWLVIVLLFTILFSSCSKGDDVVVGSKKNKAEKPNGATMSDDSGGLLEIQKKNTKRINEINDGHMKQLQEMQNESRERNNEN